MSCLGRLNVSKSTCSAGNATLTSLECCGGCRRDIIEESAIARTRLRSLTGSATNPAGFMRIKLDEQKINKTTAIGACTTNGCEAGRLTRNKDVRGAFGTKNCREIEPSSGTRVFILSSSQATERLSPWLDSHKERCENGSRKKNTRCDHWLLRAVHIHGEYDFIPASILTHA